jgi:MFS family permease
MAERAIDTALRRLMPLLVGMHLIGYIDRVNITFAESQLERDLGLSGTMFGLAAGIFFVGFVLFEIPSNLLLWRVGARRWLARIMISWGVIATATGLVWDTASLLVMRVLLGVAEAGFFPGVIFLLACWFPSDRRGQATAIFLLGIVGALALGGPVSGALLELDGVLGVEGWRWLFIVEGIPAVIVGLYALHALPERPADAPWLTPEERSALEQRLAEDEAESAAVEPHTSLREVISDRRVITLAAIYFFMNFAGYGFVFWMADVIERIGGLSSFEVGLIAAIPLVIGSAGLYFLGHRSDQVPDRRRVLRLALLLGCVGAVGAAALPPVIAVGAIALGAFGALGAIPVFWGLAGPLLSRGRAAAGGIAFVTSIGVLGGLPGPVAIGAVKDATGSLDWALLVPAASSLVAVGLLSALRLARSAERTVGATAPAA